MANKESWNALPADLQEKILKLFEDKYEMATYEGASEDDENLMALMKKDGVSFFDPSAEDKEKYLANTPVILDQWKERSGPRAEQALSVINKVLGTNY